MMNRVFAFFRVQEKGYMAAKSGIFMSFIFPAMMVFIFGSIMPPEYLRSVIPGLIGFAILADSLFAITAMASRYRERRIFSQLSLTPLRRSEWLISVFIWHLLIAAASFALIVAIGHFAYGVSISLHILVIPYIIFGTLLFVSLGLLIGTAVRTTENASVLSNAVGFPMMILTGTFFPITMLPSYLQTGVKVLPLYYFVQGMGDAMVTGNIGESILYLAVLAGLSLAFFAAAVYLFRWRER